MSVALTVNGTTFNYPTTNDTAWGYDATGWAVAITAGTLPKAGGTFTLTGPVNFGSIAGLLAKSFSSNATSAVATSGVLNLVDTDSIAWRNTTNTGDNLLGVNGSNQIIYNGIPISGNQLTTKGDLLGYSTQAVRVPVGSNQTLLMADSTQADGLSYSALVVGAGISLNYASNVFTFANTGVLSITTNTGLSTNVSATGNVTITNTGVLSITTNTGLSTNVSATGNVTITNTGVLSYSLNDQSTTPIYLTAPTGASTGNIASTLTLIVQQPNYVFAGPASGSSTAQPNFRHLVAADLGGTAPGSATDIIYNGTVNGIANSFAADGGFTYTTSTGTVTLGTTSKNSTINLLGTTSGQNSITSTGGFIDFFNGSPTISLEINSTNYMELVAGGEISFFTNAPGTVGVQAEHYNIYGAWALGGNPSSSSSYGTSGQVLTSSGATAPPIWSNGIVTYVAAATAGSYAGALTITGSPITTSGTITITPNEFTSTTPGVVPASGGGSTNYLNASGTWTSPSPPTEFTKEYATAANGGSHTMVIGGTYTQYYTLMLNGTGTVSSYTINFPTSPNDGMTVCVAFNYAISGLSIVGNSGSTVFGGLGSAAAQSFAKWTYDATTKNWFRSG
jgi:hypothetical protein